MISSGKLQPPEGRLSVSAAELQTTGERILEGAGCHAELATLITSHLVDSDLCGVESHGIFRARQYAKEFRSGYLNPYAIPSVDDEDAATMRVDGQGGIGIAAMDFATRCGISAAKKHGVVAIGVQNIGHTGRLGAFGEMAAKAGCLFIACGGGARERWRMVAPYGGAQGMLPTNPWCVAIPGGDRGPAVLDFATGQIAGGWIYAAEQSGALLPEGAIIDAAGQPTRNPADFFDGGAILPKGGVLGYGLATMGELICDAMLGPAKVECNTFVLMVDTQRYCGSVSLRQAAEQILTELRTCPPLPGHAGVRVPGEYETQLRKSRTTLEIPVDIWKGLQQAAGASDKR